MIPEAVILSDIFLYKKFLGQLALGPGSWIKAYNEETQCIHHYLNVGGTISIRCSHNSPNLGQVPALLAEKTKGKDGKINPAVLDSLGKPFPECFNSSGELKPKVILLDKQGGFGFESRSLFYTPNVVNQHLLTEDGTSVYIPRSFVQVGVDLSGIEFRMLAESCAKYDKGELIEVIMSGEDIHEYNMSKTGITNRDIIKRGLYAMLYGASDYKIGVTLDPMASPNQAISSGKAFRAALMRGLPALAAVVKDTLKAADRGFLVALDGRRLPIRSPHSALNLQLQSMAAVVAKTWLTLTNRYCINHDMVHSWDGDYALLAFVHDEIQAAVAQDRAEVYKRLCLQAAADAGTLLGLKCPIEAKPQVGQNWAECH
jgi:DNA polymerase I-like protein with 3'-5' exonuclease and polymerase domains